VKLVIEAVLLIEAAAVVWTLPLSLEGLSLEERRQAWIRLGIAAELVAMAVIVLVRVP
jgi:hypothetical protein